MNTSITLESTPKKKSEVVSPCLKMNSGGFLVVRKQSDPTDQWTRLYHSVWWVNTRGVTRNVALWRWTEPRINSNSLIPVSEPSKRPIGLKITLDYTSKFDCEWNVFYSFSQAWSSQQSCQTGPFFRKTLQMSGMEVCFVAVLQFTLKEVSILMHYWGKRWYKTVFSTFRYVLLVYYSLFSVIWAKY